MLFPDETIPAAPVGAGDSESAGSLILPVCSGSSVSEGDFVNIYYTGSSPTCVRPADASTIGKEAHGFVRQTKSAGELVTVYLPGNINELARLSECTSGVVPAIGGYTYLSDSDPGAYSMSAPTITGHFVQKLGLPIVTESIT